MSEKRIAMVIFEHPTQCPWHNRGHCLNENRISTWCSCTDDIPNDCPLPIEQGPSGMKEQTSPAQETEELTPGSVGESEPTADDPALFINEADMNMRAICGISYKK